MLMENRNALFVDVCLTKADGHAERVATLHMAHTDGATQITLAANLFRPVHEEGGGHF
jgi:hypothetical protein